MRWAGVRRVLIAGDRRAAGEDAAHALQDTLMSAGLVAPIALPPVPWGDWNEAGAIQAGEEKGG